jgi:hypothetical protein
VQRRQCLWHALTALPLPIGITRCLRSTDTEDLCYRRRSCETPAPLQADQRAGPRQPGQLLQGEHPTLMPLMGRLVCSVLFSVSKHITTPEQSWQVPPFHLCRHLSITSSHVGRARQCASSWCLPRHAECTQRPPPPSLPVSTALAQSHHRPHSNASMPLLVCPLTLQHAPAPALAPNKSQET